MAHIVKEPKRSKRARKVVEPKGLLATILIRFPGDKLMVFEGLVTDISTNNDLDETTMPGDMYRTYQLGRKTICFTTAGAGLQMYEAAKPHDGR